MDIYLTDLETGDRLRFPMLPEKINVQTGGIFQSYTILSTGDVKLPVGDELDNVGWNAILPGRARQHEPYVREWRNPQEITGLLDTYKTKGKKLRLMVTETRINIDVYIERFNGDYTGGYGDFNYTISFLQAKALKVSTSGASTSTAPPLDNKPQQERPSPPPPTTHTVTSGDTLWRIAQKHFGAGSEHSQIYEANRDAIENEARRRGMKSSDNGHWIFPGTVLTLPDI
jgi:nucleoid-associated protein YgaU